MKEKSKNFLTLLFLGFVAVITLQNLGRVDVHFLNYSFSAPKAVVIVLFFSLGTVFGRLLSWLKKNSSTRNLND